MHVLWVIFTTWFGFLCVICTEQQLPSLCSLTCRLCSGESASFLPVIAGKDLRFKWTFLFLSSETSEGCGTLCPRWHLLVSCWNYSRTESQRSVKTRQGWMCRDVIFLQVWVNAPVWKWHGEKSVVSLGCFKKQKGPKSLCRKQSTETRICLLFFFLCLLICVVYIVIIDVSYEYTYFIFNCLKCSEKSCSTLYCNFFF